MERLYQFLDIVSGITVGAQLVELGPHRVSDQDTLLVSRDEVNEGLDGVSALLVGDQLEEVRLDSRQDLNSLQRATHLEQFLYHVVPVFMRDQLHYGRTNILQDILQLSLRAFLQEALQQSRRIAILDKLNQVVGANQFLKIEFLRRLGRLLLTLLELNGDRQ